MKRLFILVVVLMVNVSCTYVHTDYEANGYFQQDSDLDASSTVAIFKIVAEAFEFEMVTNTLGDSNDKPLTILFKNRDQSGGGMLVHSSSDPDCFYVGVSSKQGEAVAWQIFNQIALEITKSGDFVKVDGENCIVDTKANITS